MMFAVLAAAMIASPVVIAQPASNAPPARYVRMNMKVDAYGINGNGTLLVDRRTGRYFQHFDIGPASFYQGFDGARAWESDGKGATAIQGNAVDRGTVIAWGYFFAFPRPIQVNGPAFHYPDIPQAVSFRLDAAAHQPQRFALSNGLADETITFGKYRAFAGGITAPAAISFTDDNGTWKARVTSVDVVRSVRSSDFAPPTLAEDFRVSGGVTSVHFLTATEILIPVRINNGPPLHFILDTGGQNVLLEPAVKRLGLRTVGHGTVGGAGAGVIPTSFATVRSVRIGSAEMRNQPFLVLDTPLLKGIDGIVGFELLSRFGARIDYRTNTLTLAASVPDAWKNGVAATPFTFRSHQPQVVGAIDAFPATLTIDTGNSGDLDINAPFALRHHLWTYYRAAKPKHGSLVGVGGRVPTSNVTVRRLQLGAATLQNVYGDLTQAVRGIEAHPAVAANVGEGVFRNFTLVLDYSRGQLYFAPGGIQDRSGVEFASIGDRIVVRSTRTHLAMRAGVRAGMTLTGLNGKTVTARDLGAVQKALSAEPGTTVNLVFDGRKRVKLLLLNYL